MLALNVDFWQNCYETRWLGILNKSSFTEVFDLNWQNPKKWA